MGKQGLLLTVNAFLPLGSDCAQYYRTIIVGDVQIKARPCSECPVCIVRSNQEKATLDLSMTSSLFLHLP